jgi:predicted amidohydrolase YtcJ
MADQNTRRIDLEGKTVIPGVIETHGHQHVYALDRWFDELEALDPNLRDFRPRTMRAESAEDFLAQLGDLMTGIEPGRWTQVVVTPQAMAREVWEGLSIADIDRLSPNNPLMVWTVGPGPSPPAGAGASSIFYNSQIGQAVRQRFGHDARGLVGPDGSYHGRGNAGLIRSGLVDLVIQEPMQSLAHVYRKEMEAWASKGVTTWSSNLTSRVNLNVYAQLDRTGAMPMRFAYSHGMGTPIGPTPLDSTSAWETWQAMAHHISGRSGLTPVPATVPHPSSPSISRGRQAAGLPWVRNAARR